MDKYLEILHKYWGYDSFRGIQREIIDSIGAGRDTLGLMPTGGGKSITFQVPALAEDGCCIVITPLIALMKDQVAHLRRQGIHADAIYTGRSRQEIIQILENCIFGHTRLLYVSPERLASPLFLAKLKHIPVSFITVDEAHCISQWGYDFRPSYLTIADIRKIKPNAPVLALTATATPEVVDDIQERLAFKAKNVYRMSFMRDNLSYVVRHVANKDHELVHILQSVDGCAIVYSATRKQCREHAELLSKHGISATYYHAGLENATKDERQQAWQNDEVRVMVATNAFGMGIDKPDVRLVIHYDSPSSPEAYFQEAGRAGRDGKRAYAVLLHSIADDKRLIQSIGKNFPPKDFIRDIYEHLAYFYQIGVGSGMGRTFMFDVMQFCKAYHYQSMQVESALMMLQRCGYINYESDPETKARVMMLLDRSHLYRLDNLSRGEDAVITALLRNYGGLYADYQFFDESFVAKEAGVEQPQAYMILKNLSARRILDFIPQAKTPMITYLTDRIDGADVVIPEDVYETRKEQYARRVQAMLDYINNDSVCRSRQLLAYFGETESKICGICDNCITHLHLYDDTPDVKEAISLIVDALKDKEFHTFESLLDLKTKKDSLDKAIEWLMEEDKIETKGDAVKLK